MRSFSVLAVLLGATTLGACVSATSPESYGGREQLYWPLAQSVYLQATKPNPDYDKNDINSPERIPNKTPIGSLPDPDPTTLADLTYKGLFWSSDELTGCLGGCGPKSLPEMQYFADLTLVIDLDGQDVSGNLSNFITNRDWFLRPEGAITLSGEIYELNGFAYILFSGEDQLTYEQYSAIFTLLSADGGFGGNSGQVLGGEFKSDFNWIAGKDGFYVGSVSESDGLWIAELN